MVYPICIQSRCLRKRREVEWYQTVFRWDMKGHSGNGGPRRKTAKKTAKLRRKQRWGSHGPHKSSSARGMLRVSTGGTRMEAREDWDPTHEARPDGGPQRTTNNEPQKHLAAAVGIVGRV